ncbi:Saccharopine dehydrogenase, NADP-dependent [Andreprevotia lacus DSM 23236]|jgi:saccharopine dehydrogenase-like NADP-dependent oxidoreductase|uniref:Saccharopine dehydrogenase, NADP-dependent n=1 Tax=Andreprevotia lacus DSM 23236 TaxID=1121001 RepID=A0A1W1X151_9NEIS|nr:saccharopine dehydrogenase NADP-binding domain-containing protein [Andreprevotia lacus]SMC17634.1 Saccharopine dehydrogenase, NADP-dependent [Andreprevotia lacus DSM 23236]
MRKIVVIGAGKIGASIAKLLVHSGDYDVTVADRDEAALGRLTERAPVRASRLDSKQAGALAQLLAGQDAVVSATSFDVNPQIARAALAAGCSYFDLTEDVATTRAVRRVAGAALPGQIFMPQCGLAPGFIGILAAALSQRFDVLDTVKMRVGALPQYPSNTVKYNLTWSTDGLINEYCNPCEAIHEGHRIDVLALEGLEHFALDGLEYEAFNTSGGLGTLCETLAGRVHTLNYKTVRYAGHQYLMDFLVNGLRLGASRSGRRQLKQMLEAAIPITLQDVVLIFVSVSGQLHGQFRQITDARKLYHRELFGENWSAIQLTTAASAAAVLDLHFAGRLPECGFVRQEDVQLHDFLDNRFGRYYATDRYAEEIPV